MPRKPTDKLFLHDSGQWAKKVRGKLLYFGRDEREANTKWLAEKPYHLAGRQPPSRDGSASIVELGNRFADEQEKQIAAGEIGERHAVLCEGSIRRLIGIVGQECRPHTLSPLEWSDVKAKLFEPVKRTKPVRGKTYGRTIKRRANETVAGDVRRIRLFLTWCFENELSPPMRWGKNFSPSTKATNAKKAPADSRVFSADEIRQIIDAAGVRFRPILLLGINAGLGGWDIANMTKAHVTGRGDDRFIDLPRLKTGTDRRFWLWPETRKAIDEYLVWRERAASHLNKELLFLTKHGFPWIIATKKERKDSIGTTFRKIRKKCGIDAGGFYDFRRMFQTVGAETLDFPAVKFVMGHAKKSRDMSERYTQMIGDDRIKNVCFHVRFWLFEKNLSPTDAKTYGSKKKNFSKK